MSFAVSIDLSYLFFQWLESDAMQFTVQHSTARGASSRGRYLVVGVVWCGCVVCVLWCGVVWVWCGVVWCGVVVCCVVVWFVRHTPVQLQFCAVLFLFCSASSAHKFMSINFSSSRCSPPFLAKIRSRPRWISHIFSNKKVLD